MSGENPDLLRARLRPQLQESLQLGLSVVTEKWNYRARDWVTSVHAADIDDDGEIELIACSRDGRVYAFNTKGQRLWRRVVGSKAWVGTVAGVASPHTSNTMARIIAGTRNGKIYALDKDGGIVGKDGTVYPLPKHDHIAEEEPGKDAHWFDTGYVIRQVFASQGPKCAVLIGSEDRYVHALNYETGEKCWSFLTGNWVRSVFSCDINKDGRLETLAGSMDKYLYVLDEQGTCINSRCMEYAIHSVFAADIDNDGAMEILVATDEKKLFCLSADLEIKWQASCDKRLLSLSGADINNDHLIEIIAGSEDNHVYIFDSHGHRLWRHNLEGRVYSVRALDIDGDGQIEILAGSGTGRIHVLRVQLVEGEELEEKIHSIYQALGKPDPASLKLPGNLETLLRDVLSNATQQLAAVKDITLTHIKHLLDAQDYRQALSTLLKLERQKAQVLWHQNCGQVHTLDLGDIVSDRKREIVAGTSEGSIHAFDCDGQLLWEEKISDKQVLSVQIGYLGQGKWAEVLVCSTDGYIRVINASGERAQRPYFIDQWLSSMHIYAPHRNGPAYVLAGTEQEKLLVFQNTLEVLASTINVPSGVKTVYMLPPDEEEDNTTPGILVGVKKDVYAYSHTGTELWHYETYDTVQAISAYDIDGDDQIEVLIGSEDRNIHVVNCKGQLRWRYYLPDTVFSVDVQDIDQDNHVEILVACADGYMYVLDRDGDLLWKYEVGDRLHVVRAADIDDRDDTIEIALGAEDGLQLLQMAKPLSLRAQMQQCWNHIQAGKSFAQVIAELSDTQSDSYDPLLHVFALQKITEQKHNIEERFRFFAQCLKNSPPEVRQALVHYLMLSYGDNRRRARDMLDLLVVDSASEVRQAVLECILDLAKHDWKAVLEYLTHFSSHSDRHIRRMTVRKLHQSLALLQQSLDVPQEEIRNSVFALLLKAARDEESTWVRQEAGRALASFLDTYHGDLFLYLFQLNVYDVSEPVLRHISHNARTQPIRHAFQELVPLRFGLNEKNVVDRLEHAVRVLEQVRALRFGDDVRLIYRELLRLLKLSTIEDIAAYQCNLTSTQFTPANRHFPVFLQVIERINIIPRLLNVSLRRDDLNDRLTGLLDASRTIDRLRSDVEHAYQTKVLDMPMSNLPDRLIFDTLLTRWQQLLLTQLNELRGHPELDMELRTRKVHHEEQVVVLLHVTNKGRGFANNMTVTLLSSNDFALLGPHSCETELLFSGEDMPAEFTIKPLKATLNLKFSITYEDINAEPRLQELDFCDRLELQTAASHEFMYIPNPYSTGTPTHDKNMFYGRDRDMVYLQDNLTRPLARTILVLYGQRRSGKTSLLLQLQNSIAQQGHIPILIDMQRLSYNLTLSNFFYRLAYYIFQALGKHGQHIERPQRQEFEVNDPTFVLDQFFDSLDDLFQEQKLVVLMDEFEVLEYQVKKGVLKEEVFEYLRSLMQARQYMNFLLAGTHKIEQLTQSYWSVFFNIARHYRLGNLGPGGAQDLIRKPVSNYLEYDPLAVEKIRQLTDDQPYLIHLICRSLVDHCNDMRKSYVTMHDVNVVLQEVMLTGQNHFGWIWDQFNAQERVLLSALAEGGDARSFSLLDLHEMYNRLHIPYVREQVLASLKTLIAADIVENVIDATHEAMADGARYRVPVGLIRQWLRRERPLEQVRKAFLDA